MVGVGGNTVIEARFAESKVERLPALAQELVAKHVDVIVAVAITAIHGTESRQRHIIKTARQAGVDPSPRFVNGGFRGVPCPPLSDVGTKL